MFAPGLGKHFQFHISGVGTQAVFAAAFGDPEIALNGFHLFQCQSQSTFFAQLHQFIVADFQIVFFNRNAAHGVDFGHIQRQLAIELTCGEDLHSLDKFVGKKFASQRIYRFRGQIGTVQQIFYRTVDIFIFSKFSADDISNSFFGGTPHIVGNPGFETNDHQKTAAVVISSECIAAHPAGLQHRIGQIFSNTGSISRTDIGRNSVNITGTHAVDLDLQKINDLFFGLFAPGIMPFTTGCYFNAIIHISTPLGVIFHNIFYIFCRCRMGRVHLLQLSGSI